MIWATGLEFCLPWLENYYVDIGFCFIYDLLINLNSSCTLTSLSNIFSVFTLHSNSA